MPKPKITRTYGPIHFEDLDPQRFEDLVRELVYDFRDWQSIEATGKGGADDGMDIRAYERLHKVQVDEEGNEDQVPIGPMNGNKWQIQCKRYTELGPQKIKEIIEHDLAATDRPYGYILVASCNFSKKAYDTFRSVLVEKGIMEFYLWGKPELETMLYLPKNDRILFTFFGISLATKRRARTTEVKTAVTNKNKLFRILGAEHLLHVKVFVRDLNDSSYPFQNEYPDFKSFPRWGLYDAIRYSLYGIYVLIHEYFGYWDERSKTWDYTSAFDFVWHEDKTMRESDDPNFYRQPKKEVISFWEGFPYKFQAKYKTYGLLRFEDMLLIDEKGDYLYNVPHIYMDFKPATGPFGRYLYTMGRGNQEVELEEEKFKRICIFPDAFPEVKVGTVYQDRKLKLDTITLRALSLGHPEGNKTYYAGDTYDFLKEGDTIAIADPPKEWYQNGIRITFIEKKIASEMLDQSENREFAIQDLARRLGRSPDPDELITLLEFKQAFMSAYEDKS